MTIERDEWARVRTYSPDRALEFFGLTRETGEVIVLEIVSGGAVYGVKPKEARDGQTEGQ